MNKPDVFETELQRDLNLADSITHLAPISMMRSASTAKKDGIKGL